MSQENVERLRPLYDAWRRGAYDEGLDVLDPNIEWVAAAEIPGHPGTSYGRAAASKYLAEWRETWETYSVEVERFIELGDQVLALARERGRGRGSGLTVQTEFAQLWTMQDGRAVRMQEWRTWKDALEAVGLRE
jgi:ketosteroid isomerase-like protein